MPRLYVSAPLAAQCPVTLDAAQSHYLGTVMRLKAGDDVALFNGQDGEWQARLTNLGRKGATAEPFTLNRPQRAEPDLWLLAAPLKKDRTDWLVEKAAELGVSVVWPVQTARTNAARINPDRLTARMIEAAEQCERLTLPRLLPLTPLERVLEQWDPARALVFLDEGGAPPLLEVAQSLPPGPLAVLIGPEGGFDAQERQHIHSLPYAHPAALGPRLLRAETAALSAVSLMQATRGDWSLPPRGPHHDL